MGTEIVKTPIEHFSLSDQNDAPNIINILHSYFTPKKNLTLERYKFFSRKQEQEESIDAFASALSDLSLNCELGDLREALVKDLMICGLADSYKRIQERLLEIDPSTLEDAFSEAKSIVVDYPSVLEENPLNHNGIESATKDSSKGVKLLKLELRTDVKRGRKKRSCRGVCGRPNNECSCSLYAVDTRKTSSSLQPSSCVNVKLENDASCNSLEIKNEIELKIKSEEDNISLEYNEGNLLPKESKKKNLKCKHCAVECASHSEFKVHALSHSQKPYTCKECDKRFKYKHHLTRHLRIHTGERPHMCSECGKCFIQESALYVHLRTHSGEKPYVCNYCEKHFRQKLYLVVHMRTHTKEKPHQCHYCGKCFSQKSALNVHVRGHTGETPYQCVQCDKAFAYKVDFNTHLITHTGQTPHRCRDCGKSFSTKAVLKKHTRKHTGERPFSCTICCKAFSFKHHLLRHMRLHGESEKR